MLAYDTTSPISSSTCLAQASQSTTADDFRVHCVCVIIERNEKTQALELIESSCGSYAESIVAWNKTVSTMGKTSRKEAERKCYSSSWTLALSSMFV